MMLYSLEHHAFLLCDIVGYANIVFTCLCHSILALMGVSNVVAQNEWIFLQFSRQRRVVKQLFVLYMTGWFGEDSV